MEQNARLGSFIEPKLGQNWMNIDIYIYISLRRQAPKQQSLQWPSPLGRTGPQLAQKGRTPRLRQGLQDATPVQCSDFCGLNRSFEPEGLKELRAGVAHAVHGAAEGHLMPSGVRGAPTRQWGADDSPEQAAAEHAARHSTDGPRTQPSAARGVYATRSSRGVADGPSLTER